MNELQDERRTCIPTRVEAVYGFLSFGLPLITSIDVAYKMVADIVAHMQLQEVAKLAQFSTCARSGQHTGSESS